MRALVTGGAGFIGSHLARYLLAKGWKVVIVDNLSSGSARNMPPGAEFRWVDLTYDGIVSALPQDRFDVVFHLASRVGQESSFEHPSWDLKANATATLNVLQWCQQKKIGQVVLASSVNVYGDPDHLPVTEATPVRPKSFYAVSKMASEWYCRVFQDLGLNTTILRLFNVYGPLQDLSNLKQGMVSIYMAYVARGEPVLVRGSKDRFRDFVYIDDVVEAFYGCVNERAYGKTYNVATAGRPVCGN